MNVYGNGGKESKESTSVLKLIRLLQRWRVYARVPRAPHSVK